MQITRLHIENFKGIKNLLISFAEEVTGRPRPLTLLLGDNGSGKTTVLQAIALVLSLATRKTPEPSKLAWPGFLPERMSSLGKTLIHLTVRFEDDEIAATQALYDQWVRLESTQQTGAYMRPGNNKEVDIFFDGIGCGYNGSDKSPEVRSQFLGRLFLHDLLRSQPQFREFFKQVGDVFWFDQNRNLTSIGGLGSLRESLNNLWMIERALRGSVTDYLGQMEEQFTRFFSGAHFIGPRPPAIINGVPRTEDFYFMLERADREYDLAEMSSGEQAVFPLIYEFTMQNIARSVVLIDELDLHLHPPQQQRLLTSLRRIGPDCQFIVTSHSSSIESVTLEEWKVRLEGGKLCL